MNPKKHAIMDEKRISRKEAEQKLPGAADDSSAKEKVSERMVKDDVKELNNNPRNTDDKMP